MGVKGLTPGRENSLGGDHMVFRGNEGGIGCRTAEHKGGGALWKVEGGITKILRSLKKGKGKFYSDTTRIFQTPPPLNKK